jgi:hypothetical protein
MIVSDERDARVTAEPFRRTSRQLSLTSFVNAFSMCVAWALRADREMAGGVSGLLKESCGVGHAQPAEASVACTHNTFDRPASRNTMFATLRYAMT